MRKNLTTVLLTAGGLLAVVILTFYIHRTNRENTLSQFSENQLHVARQAAIQIESYLRSRSHDLQRLSSSVVPQDPDRKRMAANILSNFEHLKTVNVKDISLLDEQGVHIFSTTAGIDGESHAASDLFSWAREPANRGAVWIGYEKADGERKPAAAGGSSAHLGISLATPLYRDPAAGGRQEAGGKFAGALMFKLDLEGMLADRSLLFTPAMGLHGFWMMDRDGTVLVQSDHPEMLMKSIRGQDKTCQRCHVSFDHVETMLLKTEGISEYQLTSGPRKIAAFAPLAVSNASWIIVVTAPMDRVTAFVQKNLRQTLLLLGLVVFLLGIAFVLSYRSYREKVDHENAINAVLGISLLTLPLEAQLERMFEVVIALPWLKVEARGGVFLVGARADVLVMTVQKGLAPRLGSICAEVPFGRCLCGRAALTGEIVFAAGVDERHENRYDGIAPHGHYCVPIKLHDNRVFGVMNLYLKAGHRHDKREEDFLKAITDVMAGVVERSRAERSLRESEERFRRIFDEGPFGMVVTTPEDAVVMTNNAFCELSGYAEPELVGRNIMELIHEEDREKSRTLAGQLLRGDLPRFRQEVRYIGKDGGIVWTNVTTSMLHGAEGNETHLLILIENRTESRRAAERIHLLSNYDGLTGLPNRTLYKELTQRFIGHAQRHKEMFAIIYIGIDHFQRINDTLGRGTGDLLLKAIADRLVGALRKSDYMARLGEGGMEGVVSRVGGDEFVVLAQGLTQAQDAATASHRLLRELSASYDLNGQEIYITASIGIALYPDDGADVDDLLTNADAALGHAKKEGKNNYQFYSKSMNSSVREFLILENDLRKGLMRNELVLYYQPKVEAATRTVKGMEALVRWVHPEKGLISPMKFIPLAEACGLIVPIGEFVIRAVCGQIKTWREAGFNSMTVALNVSGRQFDEQNLIEIVQEALQDAMVAPQCLVFEITESTIMRNPKKAIQTLTEIKALGIGLAIDDFGTGYSSLSYLKQLPLDYLKIDMSFVKNLVSDPNDQAIVRAIIAMAHSLHLKTIAEGVETEAQWSFLQEHGCDEMQGYLFSRPLPAEEIPRILARG